MKRKVLIALICVFGLILLGELAFLVSVSRGEKIEEKTALLNSDMIRDTAAPSETAMPTETAKSSATTGSAENVEATVGADVTLSAVPSEMDDVLDHGEGTTSVAAETDATFGSADATEPAQTTPTGVSYEDYMAMSSEDQSAYRTTFASIEDFFVWYRAAKAKYEANREEIYVGDGVFDLGEGEE